MNFRPSLSACCFPLPVAQIFSNTIFSLAPLVIGKDNDDDDDTDDDVEKEEADQCDGMEGRLRVEGSAKCVTNVIELAGPTFLAGPRQLYTYPSSLTATLEFWKKE